MQVLLAPAIVGAISLICYGVYGVNATTAGFAYLLGILGIATVWGLIEALVACCAAILCFNYFFLPPIGRLAIADPANSLALLAFLVTAVVASHLSDRAKKEAQTAKLRQRESDLLYSLSRAILLAQNPAVVGSQTAQNVAEIFAVNSVVLYDIASGGMFRGGTQALAGIESQLKQAASRGLAIDNARAGLVIAPVKMGDRTIGSLALSGISLSEGALQALLNLVAIALERVRTQEATNRAEAARQSEEFKSTLLDAITHEFKTPLTSIKAASTSILTDTPAPNAHVRELASVIDDEADRLNLLVTDAVRMAHIDASKIQLERQTVSVKEFVDHVLAEFGPRLEDRGLQLGVSGDLPCVSADPDLASLALRQVIDNSLKYSSPSAPLQVAADAGPTEVTIRVRDEGPGIPDLERDRIFDRFYRRLPVKNLVPGSGLGLYIAREIIRAHGGELWLADSTGSGSEFCLTLPRQQKAPAA
jgi:two-component system sensor histidine kinase KdpD